MFCLAALLHLCIVISVTDRVNYESNMYLQPDSPAQKLILQACALRRLVIVHRAAVQIYI